MSEKEPLNEISDSLKEIVGILKPKPKKPNYIVSIGWMIIGVLALFTLYELYRITQRM